MIDSEEDYTVLFNKTFENIQISPEDKIAAKNAFADIFKDNIRLRSELDLLKVSHKSLQEKSLETQSKLDEVQASMEEQNQIKEELEEKVDLLTFMLQTASPKIKEKKEIPIPFIDLEDSEEENLSESPKLKDKKSPTSVDKRASVALSNEKQSSKKKKSSKKKNSKKPPRRSKSAPLQKASKKEKEINARKANKGIKNLAADLGFGTKSEKSSQEDNVETKETTENKTKDNSKAKDSKKKTKSENDKNCDGGKEAKANFEDEKKTSEGSKKPESEKKVEAEPSTWSEKAELKLQQT